MARIILGSYMVRYPLGGMMSWVLQYLVGLQRLGHEVVFVEKAGWPDACYDPSQDVMTDDCTYGIESSALFSKSTRWAIDGASLIFMTTIRHGARADREDFRRGRFVPRYGGNARTMDGGSGLETGARALIWTANLGFRQ